MGRGSIRRWRVEPQQPLEGRIVQAVSGTLVTPEFAPKGPNKSAQLAIEGMDKGDASKVESWCSVTNAVSRYRRSSPMKSKAYRAVDVNGIELEAWLEGRDEAVVHVGLDV